MHTNHDHGAVFCGRSTHSTCRLRPSRMADAAAAPQSAIYSVPESVVLAATPSALPNNLSECSCDPKTVFAVASMNAVVLAEVDTDAAPDAREVTHKVACGSAEKPHFLKCLSILQASWVRVGGLDLLAVMGVGFVRVLDKKGKRFFSHELGGGSDAEPRTDAVHARGVCAVQEYLCFGVSSGAILVCECSVKSGKVRIVHKADLHGAHDAAVTTLCKNVTDSRTSMMASGDAAGRVVIWDMAGLGPLLSTGGDLPMYVVGTLESPCMSMVLSAGVLAVASFNGQLTFFDGGGSKERLVEIAAHARSPTAIAINQAGTLLASVAEDSKLMVWKFPTPTNRSSDLIFSAVVADRMLHGVTFIGASNTLAVTAYDFNELLLFNYLAD